MLHFELFRSNLNASNFSKIDELLKVCYFITWWIDELLKVCYFKSWWIDELMKKSWWTSGCVKKMMKKRWWSQKKRWWNFLRAKAHRFTFRIVRPGGRPGARALKQLNFEKELNFLEIIFPLKKLIIHRRNRYHHACSQIKLDKLQNYQQIFSFQNFWNFQKYWSAPHCKINPDTSPTVTQCVKSNTRKMRLLILIATISKTYFLFCLTCLLIID